MNPHVYNGLPATYRPAAQVDPMRGSLPAPPSRINTRPFEHVDPDCMTRGLSEFPKLTRSSVSACSNRNPSVRLSQLSSLNTPFYVLSRTSAQNEEFAAIFNLEDYKVARDKCYKQIAASIAKYREIKDNINEGLKFYVTLQDAINNVKQQCSDFVMTRNIQCREMLEDVQRQMAGLNFASGQSNLPRNTSHPSSDPQPAPRPSFTPPFFHRPGEQPRPAFSQPYTNYSQQQQPPPSPYQAPGQYQQYSNQPPSHDYSQPAYPGWRGPYYNTHMQQPATGHPPPSPYNVPPQNYPQGGYYRPQ